MKFETIWGLGVIGLLAASTAQASWYDMNYQNRVLVTVLQTQVNQDQTDFPVLVTEANLPVSFFSRVQHPTTPGAIDILAVDGTDTTPLSREVVSFDAAGRQLEAWVKVPFLHGNGGGNTTFYLYYNSSLTRGNDTATWSNGFAGVWHLEESSGTAADSTGQGSAGTRNNTTAIAGKIGNAQDLAGASTSYIDCGTPTVLDLSGTSPLTLETWVRFASLNKHAYQEVVTKGYQYMLEKDGANNNELVFNFYGNGAWHTARTTGDTNTSTWHHLAGRYDPTTTVLTLLLDGVASPLTAASATGPDPDASAVRFGENAAFDAPLDGRLDEIRIHSVARSNGWLQTSFNTQNDPAGFYTAGAEESRPAFTPTVTPTSTVSPTPSLSATYTATRTATPTPTATATYTHSATVTSTPTITLTSTVTPTFTHTPPWTSTTTPTISATSTRSPTRTVTRTATITPTRTITPTVTISATVTRTSTVSATPTLGPSTPASGGLDRVVVYPNPYRAEVKAAPEVTFGFMPRKATLRIYTLTGECVRVLEKDDAGGVLRWDLKTTQGGNAASGVYLYVLQAEGGERRGKLVLVR